MTEWITDVLIPLISAIIGGGLTLAGVIVTIKWEAKQKKQEEIEKVKPIIINTDYDNTKQLKSYLTFEFATAGDTCTRIFGCFKNTDNGILFIDYIESDSNKYESFADSTVDKNSYFSINMYAGRDEQFNNFKIYCHDVLGNKYYYDTLLMLNRNQDGLVDECMLRVNNCHRIHKKY